MSSVRVTDAATAYRDRTATSAEEFTRAQGHIPGGVSRQTLALAPYPFYADHAEGAVITDVDGNDYLDFVNNYTSLIHGHAFAPVVEATTAVAANASIGVPHRLEGPFADLLCERLPALERVHFTTTGSEAVTYAVRVARAATGRQRILTFEGGFHGSANELVRDVGNDPLPAGSVVSARAGSVGLEPTAALTAVYNDNLSVERAFELHGNEIACVLLEPFLGNGGLISATAQFLEHVFTAARRHGALVVLDEVQAMRVGWSGLHGRDGLEPDLLALGKIMGGGYPLAAFGGRSDLMEVLDGPQPPLVQTGTFTGMPMALAAGDAAMRHLREADFTRLNELGEQLRTGLRAELAAAGVPGHVNGEASMANVAFTRRPVHDYATLRTADTALWAAVHEQLMSRGVLFMARGTAALSTAHTTGDVQTAVSAFGDSLRAVLRNA